MRIIQYSGSTYVLPASQGCQAAQGVPTLWKTSDVLMHTWQVVLQRTHTGTLL